jgi:hypothetical protein
MSILPHKVQNFRAVGLMRKGEQTQKLKVHTESLVATPRAYRAILETVDLALVNPY